MKDSAVARWFGKHAAPLSVGAVLVAACSSCQEGDAQPPAVAATMPSTCLSEVGHQVWVEGKTFTMGSDRGYPEEGPAHSVRLDGFWIDAHEVTNVQFGAFVEATGYVTVAERYPDVEMAVGVESEMLKSGSAVFLPPSADEEVVGWWSYVPGASWRHPEGPGTDLTDLDHHPVVHIAYEDAVAYAAWMGRSLPTEAQFELAARSKRDGEWYAWGREGYTPNGVHKANTWQGIFPIVNSAEDGYVGTAPVGCFGANEYGVYDLIGNVWEWTTNWYTPAHHPSSKENPTGPQPDQSFDPNNVGYPVKVIKGGSFLCAPNYCMRYRPAARHAQDIGLGTNHIGFRTVSN